MTISGEAATLIGVIGAAILTYLGTKVTAQATRDAKRIESDKPEWKAFTDSIMRRIDAQQEELKSQSDQIDALRDRVESLQEIVETTRRKYWAAVNGLRRITQKHDVELDSAQLPPDVHDDVING
ncbi:hypothetical protein HMPREF1261_00480 [Corynebacterium sp. KPL1818]|uniref:hypothetical protein n=1 Tax=Corynebacterium sp. KPL1818 TaxID=1203559 RepID=UPI0003B89E5F|nr:hypothetical protein [Corynebacterium sp. KPL1818]ERS60816.1 hypothetical protein HMPREF1261_00480 [Corynebacterium sp. KPL1818]